MRRREKFVIASVLLSLGLLVLQYVSLEMRYLAVAVMTMIAYLVSAWALSDDLQRHEWVTIVPFPALYAGAVGLFYFLLPESLLSKVFIFGMFGVGMYALFLTSNIYSVAKGRTIQLLHAAHAVGLLFTLLTSLLATNVIFSLRLPFYSIALLVGAAHFPLIMMSLWSIELQGSVRRELWLVSAVMTLIMIELALGLSFLPLTVWNSSLMVMSWLYVGLGILHNYLRGRLFARTLTEYSLVAALIAVMFVAMVPGK